MEGKSKVNAGFPAGWQFILASASPRRRQLLGALPLSMSVSPIEIDETVPPHMAPIDAAAYLAATKGRVTAPPTHNQTVVAADTVVISENRMLGKPRDRAEAIHMLSGLSGSTHLVVTAVALRGENKEHVFSVHTQVTLRTLSGESVKSYVDTCRPYDKAGGYGIQEITSPTRNLCSPEEIAFMKQLRIDWLYPNLINAEPSRPHFDMIDQIDGSFFNVVGFPIHRFYDEAVVFIGQDGR